MRKGFTMIELIFVIVIIGILAAVAIPKLAATRDDAEISKHLSNAATCIKEVSAAVTADKNSSTLIQTHIDNAQSCSGNECFSFAGVGATDLNVSYNTTGVCADAGLDANSTQVSGLTQSYKLKGSSLY